jgi:hypothetical protein
MRGLFALLALLALVGLLAGCGSTSTGETTRQPPGSRPEAPRRQAAPRWHVVVTVFGARSFGSDALPVAPTVSGTPASACIGWRRSTSR